MNCNQCGKWAGANATLPGQPRDHLCMCQPANYTDWQQRRGVFADIVDEALASYEAWMAEDDYNATDALHKIMGRMRQRRHDALGA